MATAKKKVQTNDEVATLQATSEHYKWYDEFLCHIDKTTELNKATRQPETLIRGWTLHKKEKSIFIEPHLAWSPTNGQNKHATVENSTIFARLYLEKDKHKQGDFLTAKEWADSFTDTLSDDVLITLKY